MLSRLFYSPYTVLAEDIFNPEALNLGIENHVADINSLNYLSYAGGQLPGVYSVDIYLNDKLIDNRQIRFIFDDDKKVLAPEISKTGFTQLGESKGPLQTRLANNLIVVK